MGDGSVNSEAVVDCDRERQRNHLESVHVVENTAERRERARARSPHPKRRNIREGL